MKKYIGSVSDNGIVRVLNNKMEVIPHIQGGANTKSTDDLVFLSYEVDKVNPEFLRKNNLRFLTDEEMARFVSGENIYGEKIKKPEAPKMSDAEKQETIKFLEEQLKEAQASGKDTSTIQKLLDNMK